MGKQPRTKVRTRDYATSQDGRIIGRFEHVGTPGEVQLGPGAIYVAPIGTAEPVSASGIPTNGPVRPYDEGLARFPARLEPGDALLLRWEHRWWYLPGALVAALPRDSFVEDYAGCPGLRHWDDASGDEVRRDLEAQLGRSL